VLPFLRTRLPASALVTGSLVPDLPYYLPLRIGGFYPPVSLGGPAHTGWALVSLDVTIGVVAWTGWHAVIAAPAAAIAPTALSARLTGQVRFGLRHRVATPRDWALALTAMMVGAATHVLWDEFTHAERWGARHVDVLSTTWFGLEGYRWAQYASGVLGASALVIWFIRWWRRTSPSRCTPTPRHRIWWAVLIGAGAAVGTWSAVTASNLRAAMFLGATRGGAATLIVAAALSLLWHHRQRTIDGPAQSP